MMRKLNKIKKNRKKLMMMEMKKLRKKRNLTTFKDTLKSNRKISLIRVKKKILKRMRKKTKSMETETMEIIMAKYKKIMRNSQVEIRDNV
jgi:vacuolar-type H+-ATPase subunit F/Vma7